MRIAVFASGEGTNFARLVMASRVGIFPAEIAVLVTDKAQAPVREKADAFGIPHHLFDPARFAGREACDEALVAFLRDERIDLIVFAGYMRIVSAVFVRAFKGRIVNIHPSLLPAFPGKDPIQRALAAGVAETGATVHFVDEGIDSGEIVDQARVSVDPDDTVSTLTAKIHAAEYALYPHALAAVCARLC